MHDVFFAVADRSRRFIIQRLRRTGPLSIRELADGLPFSRQATTKHLGILIEAGLVAREWRDKEHVHWLTPEPLLKVVAWAEHYGTPRGRRPPRRPGIPPIFPPTAGTVLSGGKRSRPSGGHRFDPTGVAPGRDPDKRGPDTHS